MADSLWMKLREVPWDQFKCNPGTDKKMAKMLENLASRKEPRAMKASHDIWAALCSGNIAPAAKPSIPFLIEILSISKPGVQSEILDILLKFAHETQLMSGLKRGGFVFRKLTRSKDEVVAGKAAMMLTAFEESDI